MMQNSLNVGFYFKYIKM